MCGLLVTTAVIGQYVPGVVLTYTAVMGMMSAPPILVHFFPRCLEDRPESPRAAPSAPDTELDEFLPQSDHTTLRELLVPLMVQEESSMELEVPSELTVGLVIPSYNDQQAEEESNDEMEPTSRRAQLKFN